MKNIFSIVFLLITLLTFGQQVKVNNGTEGFWTGAMIKNGNSAQLFEVDFYEEDDSTRAAFSIPDWAYYSPLISNVIKEGRVIRFDSYFGEMTLVLDSA
ncbi:MAG: hypothetical protein HKN45_03215, partial [Flavobacteriales bacterium]|nr:hypothetical protein [Flavobacteriales bacterium]